MIRIGFLQKCNELTVIKSPCSYEVNKFYNWIHYMIKLQYRLVQRLMMNDAVKENNILFRVLFFHFIFDSFQQSDIFPVKFGDLSVVTLGNLLQGSFIL